MRRAAQERGDIVSGKRSVDWFWSDWAGDQAVRRLTVAERGLWVDLLALAAVGNPTGYVCDVKGKALSYEEIARFANCSPTEAETLIAGILEKGAASRDRTGRIYNRRTVRKIALSEERRKSGKRGAEATKLIWQAYQQNARQTPRDLPRPSVSSLLPISKTTTSFDDAPREGSAKDEIVASPQLLNNIKRWDRR